MFIIFEYPERLFIMFKNQADECRRSSKALGQDQQNRFSNGCKNKTKQHALLLVDDHPSNREEDSDVLGDHYNNQLSI